MKNARITNFVDLAQIFKLKWAHEKIIKKKMVEYA